MKSPLSIHGWLGLLLIVVVIQKMYYVFFGVADKALWYNPFVTNGVINPEGWLWHILNPIELGQFGYRVWVFCFDMTMLRVQLSCKRIPFLYLVANQMFELYWYGGWGHEWQNVTITSIMPFMIYSPKIGILSLIQKLPLWFTWEDSISHLQCALNCSPEHGFGHYSIYALLVILYLMPLKIRWKRGESWLW